MIRRFFHHTIFLNIIKIRENTGLQALQHITRSDVITDPSLKRHEGVMMARWVREQLEIRKLPMSKGCSLAVTEFGNDNPFSTPYIYKLKSLSVFKNTIYQENALQRKRPRIKAIDLDRKLSKLNKNVKENILEIMNNPSDPMYQVLLSFQRDY